MVDGSHEVLTSLLDELGWSPRALVWRINHVIGAGTASYHWRETGYHPMAAHVLADLAFHAATREHSRDAIALGQAAARIAAVSPAGVRALVQARLAYGHALAGQLDDFERAHATGLDTIADRDPAEEPAGMYYLTPNHLDTKAGCALTHADTLAAAAGDHQTGTI